MTPTLRTAISCYVIGFIAAPPTEIDGIREPVAGSFLYGNNIIFGAIIPSSNAIRVHFYPIQEAASMDEQPYNKGPYQNGYFPILYRSMFIYWQRVEAFISANEASLDLRSLFSFNNSYICGFYCLPNRTKIIFRWYAIRYFRYF